MEIIGGGFLCICSAVFVFLSEVGNAIQTATGQTTKSNHRQRATDVRRCLCIDAELLTKEREDGVFVLMFYINCYSSLLFIRVTRQPEFISFFLQDCY